MAFARWDPLGDLVALRQRVDRFVTTPAGWSPPVDLHETETSYVLSAELPGLTRDDVHVQFADGRLTFEGQRQRSASSEHFHCIERGHGPFRRSFQLLHPVDATRIAADLSDGVLTITVPKSAVVTRRVNVS